MPLPRARLAAGLLLLGAASAHAQAPNAPRRPNGFANQQEQQAWATARIAASPLRHEWVAIKHGDRMLRAWVTYPAGAATAPVVLVTHEVFGLTDSTKNTADEIARMGYVTVATDMVSGLAPNGGGTPDFPAGLTGQMMTAMPDQLVNGTFDTYIGWALKLPRSNGKLAMVGLSWGGGASFRYAATPGHNTALKLVCIFFDVGPPTVTQGPNRLAPQQPASLGGRGRRAGLRLLRQHRHAGDEQPEGDHRRDGGRRQALRTRRL